MPSQKSDWPPIRAPPAVRAEGAQPLQSRLRSLLHVRAPRPEPARAAAGHTRWGRATAARTDRQACSHAQAAGHAHQFARRRAAAVQHGALVRYVAAAEGRGRAGREQGPGARQPAGQRHSPRRSRVTELADGSVKTAVSFDGGLARHNRRRIDRRATPPGQQPAEGYGSLRGIRTRTPRTRSRSTSRSWGPRHPARTCCCRTPIRPSRCPEPVPSPPYRNWLTAVFDRWVGPRPSPQPMTLGPLISTAFEQPRSRPGRLHADIRVPGRAHPAPGRMDPRRRHRARAHHPARAPSATSTRATSTCPTTLCTCWKKGSTLFRSASHCTDAMQAHTPIAVKRPPSVPASWCRGCVGVVATEAHPHRGVRGQPVERRIVAAASVHDAPAEPYRSGAEELEVINAGLNRRRPFRAQVPPASARPRKPTP